MKDSIRIVLGYLLAFITALLVFLFIISTSLKVTIFNKNYIKNVLEKNNYYNQVSNEIISDIKDYMISSGFDDEILDNIYSDDEVKEDINRFIDSLYTNQNFSLEDNKIKNRLVNNINNYLTNNKIKYQGIELDEFIDDIIKYYEDAIKIYGYADSYISLFNKINKFINLVIIISLIGIIVFVIITRLLTKNKYLGSILIASGLMILYFEIDILNKIDINNIYFITEFLSNVLKYIFNNLTIILNISSFTAILIGIILVIKNSFVKK